MATMANEGPVENHAPDVPMTRLQITMQRQIGKWPLYCVILGAGQMLSATSYQMTLLSGSNYQKDRALYVLSGIFLFFSFVWYGLFRYKPSVIVLSIPWIFFAIAFFMIGLPAVVNFSTEVNSGISDGASWAYAIASAAGFLFFGCNFGEEAGAATEVWALRACMVQGLQQLWTTALWYWGNKLSGNAPGVHQPWWIVLIVWPLAVLCLLFFVCLKWGLPDYYKQVPPAVPNFYRTLFRRKLVIWCVPDLLSISRFFADAVFCPVFLGSCALRSSSRTGSLVLTVETGRSSGPTRVSRPGEFSSWSSSSSSEFGVSSSPSSPSSQRRTRGSSASSQSVSVARDGVRCSGERPVSPSTSLGLDPSDHTSEPVSGFGSEFWTPSRVSV